MSMQVSKPECQTCGRKIPTSVNRPSSIEFRRRVNNFNTLDDIFKSKDYLTRYIKSKFRLKEYVDEFINKLEDLTSCAREHGGLIAQHNDIDDIRIWIFNYTYNIQNKCDLANPEDPVYEFLRTNYSDINQTFHDFYDNYSHWQDKPLNGNHVSRALSALGLKAVMKKIKHEGKPKCAMVLHATEDELFEILRKNGY
jgi:hypothetical protein